MKADDPEQCKVVGKLDFATVPRQEEGIAQLGIFISGARAAALGERLSSTPSSSSTRAQSGVRGRACTPASTCSSATGVRRVTFAASRSSKAGRLTGREPARASAVWASVRANQRVKTMALSLLGGAVATRSTARRGRRPPS
jgi:hypothetical protein